MIIEVLSVQNASLEEDVETPFSVTLLIYVSIDEVAQLPPYEGAGSGVPKLTEPFNSEVSPSQRIRSDPAETVGESLTVTVIEPDME